MKGNPLFEVVIQPARLLCFSKSSLKLRKYKIYINTFGVSIISPINKVFKIQNQQKAYYAANFTYAIALRWFACP